VKNTNTKFGTDRANASLENNKEYFRVLSILITIIQLSAIPMSVLCVQAISNMRETMTNKKAHLLPHKIKSY